MLCSRDTCVFAGEGYRQDAKTDNRRQLVLGKGFLISVASMAGFTTAFFVFFAPLYAVPLAALTFAAGVATVLVVSVAILIGTAYPNCLPGDALVQQLIDYQPTLKPIASVPHGAHVLTSGGFSPIYLFSHKDHKATAVMRHIETESGHAIQLT